MQNNVPKNVVGIILSLMGLFLIYQTATWFSGINSWDNYDPAIVFLNILGPFLILIAGLIWISPVLEMVSFLKKIKTEKLAIYSIVLMVLGILFIILNPITRLY